MSGCDCLEHFYGWVWVDVTGCDWVWMGGCNGKTRFSLIISKIKVNP